jgi:general secretion pathway protein I
MMPSAPGPARSGGFTLVEIVIAVAVVAISVAAAFQIVSQAAFGTQRMQERTLASWIALNRIAELRLQPAFPPIGTSDGEVEFGPAEWVWEAEVSATQVETLRRVEVTVRYQRDDGAAMATVVGFVGDPGTAAAGQPAPWTIPAGPGEDAGDGTGEPLEGDGRTDDAADIQDVLQNLGIDP